VTYAGYRRGGASSKACGIFHLSGQRGDVGTCSRGSCNECLPDGAAGRFEQRRDDNSIAELEQRA